MSPTSLYYLHTTENKHIVLLVGFCSELEPTSESVPEPCTEPEPEPDNKKMLIASKAHVYLPE